MSPSVIAPHPCHFSARTLLRCHICPSSTPRPRMVNPCGACNGCRHPGPSQRRTGRLPMERQPAPSKQLVCHRNRWLEDTRSAETSAGPTESFIPPDQSRPVDCHPPHPPLPFHFAQLPLSSRDIAAATGGSASKVRTQKKATAIGVRRVSAIAQALSSPLTVGTAHQTAQPAR